MDIESRGSLLVRYDRWKVVFGFLLPFLGIPVLLLTVAYATYLGRLEVTSTSGIYVTVVLGIILFFVIFTILLSTLFRPTLLRIDDDGKATWDSNYRRTVERLPRGAIVRYRAREVTISETPNGLFGFPARDGVTLIKLPRGLKRLGQGEFVIS